MGRAKARTKGRVRTKVTVNTKVRAKPGVGAPPSAGKRSPMGTSVIVAGLDQGSEVGETTTGQEARLSPQIPRSKSGA